MNLIVLYKLNITQNNNITIDFLDKFLYHN
jgi:hypothetical protein